MNVVITGGGTGGHLYPALNFAKELCIQFQNINIIYIGGKNSIEEEIITNKTNFKFIGIDIEGLKSIKKMHQNIKVLNKFKKAKSVCKKILSENKIDFCFGTGGYVCAPVFASAKKLNIPYYIHEQNSVFGKVVKIYKKGAKATFTSFENMINFSKKDLSDKSNIIYTMNPQTIIASEHKTDVCKKQVVIFCGSMGGYYFNENIKSLYKDLSKFDYEFIHIVGKNHEVIPSNYDNIKIIQYSSHLLDLINESAFVICRAGASTIAELIGLQKPAILVPSPFVAHKHQHVNARYLTNIGCALSVEENQIKKDLVQQIKFLIDDNNVNKYKENYKNLEVKNALKIIIQKIKGDIDERNNK